MTDLLKYFKFLCLSGILFFTFSCSSDDGEPDYVPLKRLERISIDILEPSGISFDQGKQGFWIVDGFLQKIYHTNLSGIIDSTLPFTGTDLEAVYFYEADTTLWVGDERLSQVYGFNRHAELIKQFSHDISVVSNSGIEGITRDLQGHFWIVNEKNPVMIVETDVNGEILNRYSITFAKDLSDIFYDSADNTFILLSDESKAIFLWNPESGLTDAFSLPKRKYEGLVYDPVQKWYYLVNDEDGTLEIFAR